MKELRSRKAVSLNEKQKSKLGKRIFLYCMTGSMVIAAPWIFPQIIENNQVLASIKEKDTTKRMTDNSAIHSSGNVIKSNSNPDAKTGNSQNKSAAQSTGDAVSNTAQDDASAQTITNLEGTADDDTANSVETGGNSPNTMESTHGENHGDGASSDAESGDNTAVAAVAETQANQSNTGVRYTTVDNSYFDDALFIGDSRTVGIYEYAKINNADFFCSNGLTTLTVLKESLNVSGIGKVKLMDLLAKKKYGKIYITLGINEIGYTYDEIMEGYKNLIIAVQQASPGVPIYLQANLHVTYAKSTTHRYIKNERINTLNSYIQGYADNITVFYLDPNEHFDDATGSLRAELTGDGVHFYAKYYAEWIEWLKTKAVVRG